MSEAVSNQHLPEGYKQTEVGFIPNDWETVTLSDVCSFGGGTTPSRSQHDRYFVNGVHNWIKTTDLNNSRLFVSEELVTDLALLETGLKKHPIGTVLVAMYGGFNQIGRTGYLSQPSAINQALVAIKPKPHKLNSYFLLSELNYNVDYWKGVASSSRKDPNITSNDVKNYLISLPPIKEQTAIANALSDVDALLAELEQLIAKKQAIKTATMQQLLTGKTRLPQFATYTDGERKGQTKGMKSSELGEIPEGWEVYLLSSLFDVRDGTHDSPKYIDNGIPLVTSKNIINNELDMSNVSLISGIDALNINKRSKVDKGDIIMSMIGTVGSAVLIVNEPNFCIKNVALFKPKQVEGKYIIQLIRSDSFQRSLIDSMDGGIQKFVSLGTLRSMSLVLPSEEEQTAIANILSDMDSEIQALEQRLAKTRQIKQGMMQELLTGRTRLPFDAESDL
jgi:type I restriction enzyme, S subunit